MAPRQSSIPRHWRWRKNQRIIRKVAISAKAGEEDGKYTNWRGHAFEILCMYHIENIKKALGISGVRTNEYAWISEKNKTQIDLVIERDDGIINICEEKFTDTAFSVSPEYEQNLLKKRDTYREETKTKKALKIVMISAENIAGKANTEKISMVLTLDDLFI